MIFTILKILFDTRKNLINNYSKNLLNSYLNYLRGQFKLMFFELFLLTKNYSVQLVGVKNSDLKIDIHKAPQRLNTKDIQ